MKAIKRLVSDADKLTIEYVGGGSKTFHPVTLQQKLELMKGMVNGLIPAEIAAAWEARFPQQEMTLPTPSNEMSPTARKAYETILNLRKLTRETQTITTRAQNDVLRALSSVDIAAVAKALAAQQ
jgi:hypothetical protein